ncbi:hypothetical protein D3C76_616650 [compost metagenome]
MTFPAPGDSYTRGFLTGRPRVFSFFIVPTYAITSPTWLFYFFRVILPAINCLNRDIAVSANERR